MDSPEVVYSRIAHIYTMQRFVKPGTYDTGVYLGRGLGIYCGCVFLYGKVREPGWICVNATWISSICVFRLEYSVGLVGKSVLCKLVLRTYSWVQ